MEYIHPDKIDWWRFVKVTLSATGDGGHSFKGATHYTRVPSQNPLVVNEEDWEDVIYLRRIAPKRDEVSPKNGAGGFVYILTNEAYPGLCKIGFTSTKPSTRIRQINNSGVLVDWDVIYTIRCERPYDLEQSLHLRLANYRYRKDREFFAISVREVIGLIEQIAKDFQPF
jgi:hypothetical protein